MIESQFIANTIDLDTHPSLMDSKQLVYLLNGDIQGNENSGNGVFVQNALGNELCLSLPTGYALKGSIQMDNFEFVLFLKSVDNCQIGLFNGNNCTYETIVADPCLNFQNGSIVRGVFKYTSKENVRRIYWIDGFNTNKYLDIEKKGSTWVYPKKMVSGDSLCDCDHAFTNNLDCEKLQINKFYEKPCITLTGAQTGTLPDGVYQVGVAYGTENLILTDFTFSEVIKLHQRDDGLINIAVSCNDNDFDQAKVVLVSQTASGLISYDLGFYSNISSFTVSSTNYPIISTQDILSKQVIYDNSQHIEVNQDHLLLGNHKAVEPIPYQRQANAIQAKWVEIKVPAKDAHKYHSFMRDEVVPFSIEWVDKYGQSKGVFNIPGRAKDDTFFISFNDENYNEGDEVPAGAYVYETDQNCDDVTLEVWEVENTATGQSIVGTNGCAECGTSPYSKIGKFGYYETKNLTYPNTDDWDVWGLNGTNQFVNLSSLPISNPLHKKSLKCQPIRHHRFPSHDLSHIHDGAVCENVTETIIDHYDDFGQPVFVTNTYSRWNAPECINLLGVKFENIQHPRDANGNLLTDIAGYRIHFGDRTNDKSILHKGLVFNVMGEWVGVDEPYTLYPNYPYNDLHPDIFLSKTQSPDTVENPATVFFDQYTYHSPNTQFEVGANGTEIKFYTEEWGPIDYEFERVYKHPLRDNAYPLQFNSVADYGGFSVVERPFDNRRKLERSQYLLPIKQFVGTNVKFNNYLRENSVYLKLASNYYNTSNVELSRFTSFQAGKFKGTYCEPLVDGTTVPKVVSYYTAIKIKQPDQYGQLDSIKYKPLDECFTKVTLNVNNPVYVSGYLQGGDIHISKHTVRRKHPFFTEWLYDVPFDTAYNYRDYNNVYKPVYWTDYQTASSHDKFLDALYFYLFSTGTASYWCESEYIGDFRDKDARPTSQFYPKVDYGYPVRSDNFSTEEFFIYNLSLLNESIESNYQNLKPTKSDSAFTVIYSQKNDLQSGGDRWIQFPALNYTILPKDYGKFTGMFTPKDYSIFFIFENDVLLSKVDYSLQTTEGQTIFLGQGDLFSQRLQRLGNDKTGYIGSVDPLSFINTRWGTYWIDRYRKKMFEYSGGVKDVTSKLSTWLNNYLNNSNPGYYNSIRTVFDNFTSNLYITDPVLGWTLSFKPLANGFVSWHSFISRHYLSLGNTFLSENGNSLWKHNRGNYQTYYGQVHPFDVGFLIKSKGKSVLQDLAIWTEWVKYSGYNTPKYYVDKFFNKVFIHNNHGSTGFLQTSLKRENDETYFSQNNQSKETTCEVTQIEDSEFRINKITNFQEGQPNITWSSNGVTYTPVNTVSKVPDKAGNIRGKWFKVHLRDEGNPEYKKLVQINISNTDEIKQ